MPTEHIIALLVAERDKLNLAIEALQGPIKRRGRPPKNPLMPALAQATTPATKHKSRRSAAARKAQSQRMKAYWAAKRKKQGKS